MKKIETVCQKDLCTGCMACVDRCPKAAITIQDSIVAYNAVIDTDKCVECGLCHKICQNNYPLQLTKPRKWMQGWIADESLRAKSSSGGAACALSRSFIRQGGTVCSCTFSQGEFRFDFAGKVEDVERFTGSKYVKSNPEGIYTKVLQRLQTEEKVLFIGLPCQVAALKIYVGDKYASNLYTVDLICHGTPSPKLLEDFLRQHNYELTMFDRISFRHKSAFGLSTNFSPLVQPGAVDPYMLAFLCSLDYTENCYHCKYAGVNRAGDLTIGDSWGTELPENEQRKGISLILCQTEKGEKMLQNANMQLFPVDKNLAISRQHQLREPSLKDKNSKIFFEKYSSCKFNYAVYRSLPRKYINQKIKALLLKSGLLRFEKIAYTISVEIQK